MIDDLPSAAFGIFQAAGWPSSGRGARCGTASIASRGHRPRAQVATGSLHTGARRPAPRPSCAHARFFRRQVGDALEDRRGGTVVTAPAGHGLFDAIPSPRRRSALSFGLLDAHRDPVLELYEKNLGNVGALVVFLDTAIMRLTSLPRASARCALHPSFDWRSSPGRSAMRLRIAVRNLSPKKRR
jgi:hypothetical protein